MTAPSTAPRHPRLPPGLLAQLPTPCLLVDLAAAVLREGSELRRTLCGQVELQIAAELDRLPPTVSQGTVL